MNKKLLSIIAPLLALLMVVALAALLWKQRQIHTHTQQNLEMLQPELASVSAARDVCESRAQAMIAMRCDDPVTMAPTHESPSTLAQIYEPETLSSDRQAKIDELKKRYEEVLVSYFVLRNCGLTSPTDYHVINSALSQEMASVNAPGRLQFDILTAAKGSYNELYAGNTCDAHIADTLLTQYKSYIDAMITRFTAP